MWLIITSHLPNRILKVAANIGANSQQPREACIIDMTHIKGILEMFFRLNGFIRLDTVQTGRCS